MFCDKLNDFVTIYLDDILFFNYSIEEHKAHLRCIFNKLQNHPLKAKIKKFCFGVQRLEYLGHIVTPSGITIDPEKTKAIDKYKPPTNIEEL